MTAAWPPLAASIRMLEPSYKKRIDCHYLFFTSTKKCNFTAHCHLFCCFRSCQSKLQTSLIFVPSVYGKGQLHGQEVIPLQLDDPLHRPMIELNGHYW